MTRYLGRSLIAAVLLAGTAPQAEAARTPHAGDWTDPRVANLPAEPHVFRRYGSRQDYEFPICYPEGEIYDSTSCPRAVLELASNLRLEDLARDPVSAKAEPPAVEDDFVSATARARVEEEFESQFAKRSEEHPDLVAVAGWVYPEKDGDKRRLKTDMGMALSLFARPSKLGFMKGRWVSLGAFLGKATGGFGLAWEITPHRPRVEGEPRSFELWGGPVAVFPWGEAGDLRANVGLGFAIRR